MRESRVYQASMEQALLTDAYEDAHRAFTQVKQAVRVHRVRLADATNHIVLSTASSEIGSPLPALTATADRFWRTMELNHAAGKLGVLAIKFSTAPLQQAHRTAWQLGVCIATLGMAVIALVQLGVNNISIRRAVVGAHRSI